MDWTRGIGALLVISTLALAGCGGSEEASAGDAGSSINFQVQLVTAEDGLVPFLTPQATLIELETAELVGKPYYAAIFDGGFAPGVDEPLHFTWGSLEEDLLMDWTTPADLGDGPYATVFILFRVSEVPEDILGASLPNPPVNGDLSAFTLSEQDVLEGDPPITAGVLRVNVSGGDALKTAENRWSKDPTQTNTDTFTDTILLVP